MWLVTLRLHAVIPFGKALVDLIHKFGPFLAAVGKILMCPQGTKVAAAS